VEPTPNVSSQPDPAPGSWGAQRLSPVLALYLAGLALLPWSWFPPFPWLHEHAQWSDAFMAAAAAAWLVERWRSGRWASPRPAHLAMAIYLAWAAASLLLATPPPLRWTGAAKLLGMAELCAIAVITSDLASRPAAARAIAWVMSISALAMAAAAVLGLALFYGGIPTRLLGHYGNLTPSPWYARVQAGFQNPNMLASYCIFAAGVVARRDARLPARLRQAAQAALWLAVALTLSRAILGFMVAAAIRSATTPRRRLAAGFFAAASALLIVSLTLWNVSLNPTRPGSLHIEPAPSPRLQMLSAALHAMVVHPLLGSGLATSPGAYQGRPFRAHFTPADIAATLGLPALAAFAAILALLWRDRPRPTDLAVWSGIAGLGLDAIASDVQDFRHVWLLFGLADARAPRETPGPASRAN
jgi:hypothetical protein